MAHRAYWQPTDRPPGWTAWIASLAVHAALFMAMLYVVRHQLVQAAADERIFWSDPPTGRASVTFTSIPGNSADSISGP